MGRETSKDRLPTVLMFSPNSSTIVGISSSPLGFAVLLKFYTQYGRFPRGRSELPGEAVEFVARQVQVFASELGLYEWMRQDVPRARGTVSRVPRASPRAGQLRTGWSRRDAEGPSYSGAEEAGDVEGVPGLAERRLQHGSGHRRIWRRVFCTLSGLGSQVGRLNCRRGTTCRA
ncbi:hypothetical protein GCM10009579_55710 [Streptomyces javensis]|uniref:DUF4158 domain-containing protein n=1 Tax=Streptomyces javensis TaxID=114698 RepID=A0ABN1X5A9_9ACTN